MEIKLRSQNVELTDELRHYATEKISKLTKFYDQISVAEIELIATKNPSVASGQTVEVTLHTKGHIVRAKESSTSIFASVDAVYDKLERQLKKYKEKMYSSSQRHHNNSKEVIASQLPETKIVKVKQLTMKPMTPDEATLHMDLLGHSFFVFTNTETEDVNVVYRRDDNNYGLIEPA